MTSCDQTLAGCFDLRLLELGSWWTVHVTRGFRLTGPHRTDPCPDQHRGVANTRRREGQERTTEKNLM